MTDLTEDAEAALAKRGAIQSGDMVRQMFDRIVPRYDLMNRLMTGGRDVAWRNFVARQAAASGDDVLDLATGTGDLAFAIHRAGAQRVIGADFSEVMIAAAKRKAPKHGPGVTFQVADALDLPFEDGSFDAVTVSFGLRNMSDYRAALLEMRRVLRSGGTTIVLETTPLRHRLLGPPFRFYFKRILPVVGGLLSGDYGAYRYLPTSVDSFPTAEELAAMMRDAGYANVRYRRYGLGTVAIHSGERAGPFGAP